MGKENKLEKFLRKIAELAAADDLKYSLALRELAQMERENPLYADKSRAFDEIYGRLGMFSDFCDALYKYMPEYFGAVYEAHDSARDDLFKKRTGRDWITFERETDKMLCDK